MEWKRYAYVLPCIVAFLILIIAVFAVVFTFIGSRIHPRLGVDAGFAASEVTIVCSLLMLYATCNRIVDFASRLYCKGSKRQKGDS